MIIDHTEFDQVDTYVWCSPCGIGLWLDLTDPRYPWRTSVKGRSLKSRWSTPWVAVVRTKGKMRA